MKQRGSLTLPSPAGGISQSDADARYFRIANNLSEGVAATMRTSLGLGSIATQSASAVAITGGTLAGITGLGVRDTSAAFDVTLVFTSAIPLDAGRTLTVDVGNANRSFSLWGDFVVPSGGGTAVLLGADNIFTGANEVHNAAGFVARPSILQDGVALKGRAGGTFSYTAAITTAELTASRAFTIPAVSADDTFALLGIANAFTGANTFTNAAGIVTRAAATQDGVALVGRAGGTSSYIATITTAALTASRTFTIPAVTGNDTFALLGIAQTFTAAQTFTPSGGTSANAATFNGKVVINGDATQDLRLGSAGMFLTNVANSRINILDSSTGSAYTFWSDSSLYLNKTTGNIGWRNGATTVFSDASNQIDMRNSTSAQTINVYRTYTDGSNYERMALKSASGYFEVACETAGSGTDDLDLRLTPAGTGLVNLPGGTLLKTRTALTDGAGVNTGTLLNAPASGNPTKWVPINDNGTTRYIPMW